jgi:Holliday junction resolvase RusA-like endonuclease
MLKIEKEYNEKYGDIPSDSDERLNYLLRTINLKKSQKKINDEISRIKNIKWKTIKYTIYLLPKATPRPRSGKNGVFYVKGAKDNKKIFEKFMTNQDIDIITTPTKFYCNAYFPIPSSMSAVEKVCAELGFIRPTSKPDWDNVAKTYCDMCQGFLIYDDSLIVEGTTSKYYSVKPRIEVTISYMEDYDSNFNKRKIIRKGD